MFEKGTLCHATTRWDMVLGVFPPTCASMEGVEGELRGLEGREKAFGVFFEWNYMMYCVSLCKLKQCSAEAAFLRHCPT